VSWLISLLPVSVSRLLDLTQGWDERFRFSFLEKVFAKFTFRFRERFYTKRRNIREKFAAKTKYLISRKHRGKNHSIENFVFCITKNIERSQSRVKMMWFYNIFNYGGDERF
jgi:hypothetical protein